MTAINRDYEVTKSVVTSTFRRFIKNHPLRLRLKDEYESASGEAFVNAWETYDPAKSSFETWVRWKVWKSLQQEERVLARRWKYAPVELDALERIDEQFQSKESFSLSRFLLELSPDARLICLMALEPSAELLVLLKSKGVTKDDLSPYRKTLLNIIRTCLDRVGWSNHRIETAISQIQGALS